MKLTVHHSPRFWGILFALLSLTAGAQTKINLSLKTTVIDASVWSDTHPVAYVNDGVTTGSNYWSNWNGEDSYGQYGFVQLEWDVNCTFLQAQTYWMEDEENDVLVPSDAYLAWWDGHNWVKAETLEVPNERNVSTTTLDFVTNRVRLYVKSDKVCGVRELKLFGYLGNACERAVLTDDATSIAYVEGQTVTLTPKLILPDGVEEEPIWNWTMPDGTTATTHSVVADREGTYTVTYQRECGSVSSLTYTLFDPSVAYTWPKYSPTLDYDYRSEYPSLEAPTKFLPENNNQAGYMADGWWAIAWGPTTSEYVTEVAKKNILDKMNEDFAYFRDVMGWPPDKRARNGYYSTIYVYGSGLYSDNADMTARGGWQGATWYNNSSWPMVNISYYPIACFDPAFTYDGYYNSSVTDQTFQQNACVHEGIHAIFADLEGCKQSAWYQEAGNTWLQAEAEVLKTGVSPTSMGYLSAGNMIAPFMPVECYSGWLLDDTFGGPSAEGVNMFRSDGQQVCTWRNLLGGVQYGELFPHFVSEILGRGSIPWIWRNCKTRVLEGMGDALGEEQMRRLILEYRARQAMIDVGVWSTACRKLLDDNWLIDVKQEWSPYSQAVTTWKATPYANMYECDQVDSAGWWRPEYRTTPGWSGANQIPLHVNGTAGNIISLHFQPKGSNMVCMLAYRSTRGKVYYSRPIEGEGDVVMALKEKPANNVVIAIVCNTDYIYKGEETRKEHFDYRLRMGQNVYQPAKAQLKWFDYRSTIKDNTFTGIDTPEDAEAGVRFEIVPAKTVVRAGESLPLKIRAAAQLQQQVRMYSSSGVLVHAQSFLRDGNFDIPAGLAPGMYVLEAHNSQARSSVKIMVTQ